MYTVKDIAEKLNLSEHTIRFYTDKGLVPNLKRDKNNIRIFDEESINWLTGAKYLKACGMSIDDIKRYVDMCMEGDSTVYSRYEIILKQRESAYEQLEAAKQRLQYLELKTKHYLDIVNHIIPDDTNPGKWQTEKIKKAI